MIERIVTLPLKHIKNPPTTEGEYKVLNGQYWVVSASQQVLFFENFQAPLCASSYAIAHWLKPHIFAEQLGILYLKHAWVPNPDPRTAARDANKFIQEYEIC